MSLINLQTGATAAEAMRSEQSERIISDLQTRIYKQDLLIKKLNEESDRLHSQNQNSESCRKEIESLRSKLCESENVRKELSETVTHAENEIKNLQQELDRKNKEPPHVKYKIAAKCLDCQKSEYEIKAFDVGVLKQKAQKTYEEADKQCKYFYELVNNYNSEIDKRVDKIVKRKTAFQRFADWLETEGKLFAGTHFFFPFLYSVTVTIIQIIRTDIVRTDFINAIFAVEKAFTAAFNGIKWLICKAAGVSAFIPNGVIRNILWWVIVILLTLIILALILAVIFIVGFFTIEFAKFLCDKLFLSVMLADLVIVTFLGDIVKMIIPLNLVLTFLILLLAFIVIRITVNTIIKKIEGRE